MAKRKAIKYLPQPMADGIKKRFEQLISKEPVRIKKKKPSASPPVKKVQYIDRKYSNISKNEIYEKEEDLKL
ncbi:MAG: hypothetical protein WC756_12115 [Taibaiella sp.]|jgi:hypothetical protein